MNQTSLVGGAPVRSRLFPLQILLRDSLGRFLWHHIPSIGRIEVITYRKGTRVPAAGYTGLDSSSRFLPPPRLVLPVFSF